MIGRMNADPLSTQSTHALAIQSRLAELAMGIPMPPDAAPDRHQVGYQLFGVSFEHSVSITSHVQRHGSAYAASAFALARPMLETLQRGWWFTLCADDAQTQTFLEEDKFPFFKAKVVAEAIDKHSPFRDSRFFSTLSQDEWSLYHSFTHGGRAALAVYGNRPHLAPDYDPDLIPALLSNAIRMAALAVMGMCWVCGPYDKDAVNPLYEQLLAMGPELDLPGSIIAAARAG